MKYNLIKPNGELLWNKPVDEWFDNIGEFYEGYARVRVEGKWNLINTNGELLWNKPVDEWFDNVWGFYDDGYAKVKLNDKIYYLRSDGVLCDIDTKKPLENQTKLNFINTKGELVRNQWFVEVTDYMDQL